MFTEFENLKQLFQYFDDERICREYLELKRWNGTIECVYCKCTRIYRFRDERTYKCANCKKRFNVLKGTIFEKSQIPLTSWFGALYLYTSHKTAVSSVQMSKHLGISQASAWYLHHRIMEAFKVDLDRPPEHGIWEVDEVYIGPLKHRLSKTRYYKVRQGTGMIHMTGILAFYKRDGELFGLIIPDKSTKENIQPILKRYIEPLSILQTDGSGMYHDLSKYFLVHEQFIHAKKEYARGENHTNTIEGAFKHFKDTIRGSYKQLTRKHLQRYWDEFCFKYNNRGLTDVERFELIFKTIDRRITYKELVGKN